MSLTSVMRFAIYGAVGFGIAWALLGAFGGGFAASGGVGVPMFGAFFSGDSVALLFYAPVLSLCGAFGGAVLGMSLGDKRRTVAMALMGGVGFFLGSFIVVGLFFSTFYFGTGSGFLEAVSAAALGLLIGAALGLVLRSFRGSVLLALVGLVGFGIGGAVTAGLQGFPMQPSEGLPLLQSAALGAVEGIIGGASLGAALGHLESRKPAEERRPRVR